MVRSRKIILFWVIGWVVLTNLFIFYRFVGLNWSQNVLTFSTTEWIIVFGQSTFVGAFSGLFYGLLEVYFSHKNLFQRLNYGAIVLGKSVAYFLIAIVFLFLAFFIAALLNGYSTSAALDRASSFFSSAYFLVITVYLLVNTTILNFIFLVDQKFGPGNLLRIFLGTYYKPIEEERIFIFIDLKSSTNYAEVLGHIRYSHLIQDCFYDITPILDEFKAEIYQYVGDEVVLSWKVDKHTRFEDAVMTFFKFQDVIKSRSDYYISKYGFVPEFKAGLNAGKVTVTEVGVIKKEIAYHGDAINTASRIQDQCNNYHKLILGSGYFIQHILESQRFKTEYLGEVRLKGKQLPVEIYHIESKPAA